LSIIEKVRTTEQLVSTYMQDVITVEWKLLENACEMTFTQGIVVPHEEGWTEAEIEKALHEYHSQTEQGWGEK
jgi:hypothetical protein